MSKYINNEIIKLNRKNNVEIRKLKSIRGGKCRICESPIDNKTPIVRMKLDGIERMSMTVCFNCIKFINDLVIDIGGESDE